MPVQETLLGGLDLYARDAHASDEEARELAPRFAAYAAVPLRNMQVVEDARDLAENMERAMRSRAVIEQAKGILKGRCRCDASTASGLLSAASRRSNRKLRDIAQAVVDGVAQ